MSLTKLLTLATRIPVVTVFNNLDWLRWWKIFVNSSWMELAMTLVKQSPTKGTVLKSKFNKLLWDRCRTGNTLMTRLPPNRARLTFRMLFTLDTCNFRPKRWLLDTWWDIGILKSSQFPFQLLYFVQSFRQLLLQDCLFLTKQSVFFCKKHVLFFESRIFLKTDSRPLFRRNQTKSK